jgi:hypothetical protein
MKTRNRTIATSLLAVLLLVALFLGCSTNSPTAPQQDTGGDGGGVISGRWQITATASPDRIRLGESSSVRATIVNRDSGEAPPDGSSAIFTTDLGVLLQPDSALQAAVVPTRNGRAEVDLFPGAEEGTADIVVSFGNATAREQVKILDSVFLFIESVSPSSGSELGGYSATIHGTGFSSPLRVTFSGALTATEVRSVSSNRIVVTVSPHEGEGSLESGEISVSDVTVSLCSSGTDGQADCGTSDTLEGGFTYIADEDVI